MTKPLVCSSESNASVSRMEHGLQLLRDLPACSKGVVVGLLRLGGLQPDGAKGVAAAGTRSRRTEGYKGGMGERDSGMGWG